MLEVLNLGAIGYQDASERMRQWVAERQADTVPDRLVLLSHPPVITHGPRTDAADLPADLGVPTVLVDRGPVDIVRWPTDGIIAALATLGVNGSAAPPFGETDHPRSSR